MSWSTGEDRAALHSVMGGAGEGNSAGVQAHPEEWKCPSGPIQVRAHLVDVGVSVPGAAGG